ncbi:MAG: hypothetical protein IJN48_01530 [Clostridia bacterium]|nr:hypothetical protein [Clostridia bacterium]
MKKLISVLLALLISATTVFSMVPVAFATEEAAVTVTEEAESTEAIAPAEEETAEVVSTATKAPAKVALTGDEDYTTLKYDTDQEKLDTMDLMLSMNGYELYVQPYTAEIAVKHVATGQLMFSNPFDVAKSRGTTATKEKLLSQIIVNYTDNGVAKEYNSYTDAEQLDQILIEPIKNGVRVEYTIGRADANYLVPRMISVERLESEILSKIDKSEHPFEYNKTFSFYQIYDPNDTTQAQTVIDDMHQKYPVTKSGMAIYVLAADIKNRELAQLEGYIKEWAPDYSYDEMEYDHTQTQYVSDALSTPVFRMAIEYTLTEDGLEATLPANGIRFDETLYTLESITMLPFMGAGSYDNEGYTFIPDGSGALMDFGDFTEKNTAIAGTVYGMDFAYQTIEGSANQDVMRMPVFGLRETVEKPIYEWQTETYLDKEVVLDPVTGTALLDEEGNKVTELVEKERDVKVQVDATIENRGFFAIIKEGDALSKITAKHENQLHDYNTAQISFNPRPKDSYVLADSLSVGSNSEIEVVSDRKYVGNYTIKYYMLLDDAIAEANGVEDYYETSWMGMAEAYRDYLMETGVLTPLTEDDVDASVPLYIETFGSTETIEKVLSVPTTVSVALTSFEDIKTMYDELSAAGISNIDFKITGYANGGMYATIPYKLKWEKAVGGDDGYNALLEYAAEKGFGIYPDFDFAYVNRQETFDGLDLDRDIVKTIDSRYSSYREYDASLQEFVSYFTLCVSPSSYMTFYNKFADKYLDYDNTAISVSTIGSALNSDFDEDDPYNRNDTKDITVDFLENLNADMTSVMSEKGNVYTWQYVDKMLNVSLQSSRSLYASATVPFMGVVLHGSVEFAGTPINMAGDTDYEILRAIESGAGMYCILSYDNTELLKEDYDLSNYYSVRYDIWKDDIVNYYTVLNEAIGDLQTSLIVGHEFIKGERVPSEAEVAADIIAADEQAVLDAAAEEDAARKAVMAEMREQYEAGKIGAGQAIDTSNYVKPEEETDGEDDYEYTKYTSDDNQIVLVTYSNGTSFILNYNDFEITTVVDGTEYTVDGYGFVRID